MRLGDQIAVAIATYNRVETLLRTLAHLQALEEPIPIVVVDNASTDGTAEVVQREYPQVQVVRLPKNIGAVARSYGLQVVHQPYVALSDDDAWWSQGALSRAVTYFERYPRLALLMSRVLIGPEERLDSCCRLMAQSLLPKPDDLPGIPILGFVGCAVVVRREAVLAVGGFHPQLGTGGEEALLAIDLARAGWGLAYVPDIVSHHYPSSQRNVAARLAEGLRNELWTAWLRRSPKDVAQRTLRYARVALTNSQIRRGLLQAIPGLPWVLRERSRIPRGLEHQLELLERQANEFYG